MRFCLLFLLLISLIMIQMNYGKQATQQQDNEMPLITDDEIIYAAFAMDPRDVKPEPEPVQTITKDQLKEHTDCDVFWDVFREVYGRRFNYHKDSRALLCKTPDAFDTWISDLFYKATAYSHSESYRPMMPHMVELYSEFVWGPGSWTGEEASFRADNPAI
tara:strand:+ start:19 stop:501 length:483 start_codon:yes stop_codon:yes gene_type:complete